MSTPNGASPSPFAARTRAPFPATGTTSPGISPSPAGTPSPSAPAPSPGGSPRPAPPTPPAKKSSTPLLVGAGVLVLGGVILAFFLREKSPQSTPAPLSSAPRQTPTSAPAPTPKRDAQKDYDFLSRRVASLTLGPTDRAEVAAAMLQASSGAFAEANAKLGPVIDHQLDALYTQASSALSTIKLAEHPTATVRQLQGALTSAATAAKASAWPEAVAARDAAIALIPAAKDEISKNLAAVAQDAVGKGDLALATYFYEQAIRLDPANPAARAHLFAHKFQPGQVLRSPSGLEFAYLPPGKFLRGSRSTEPGRSADEEQSPIELTGGVFMSLTEVSQRQWDLVFGAGAAARTILAARAKPETIGLDLPMHSVRWDEAAAFCAQLSTLEGQLHRLPTEAEWEYACRAGTTTAFNNGADGLSARDANIEDGSAAARTRLAPVGTSGSANAWGLRDMHGNVWEWCADWSAPYPRSEQKDPVGPATATIGSIDLAMKVVRGGGWNAPASDARSANRWEYSPAVTTDYIGFRLVREPDLAAR